MFTFADSFDFYATIADAAAGYWDSFANSSQALANGRFAGSRAWRHIASGGIAFLTKSSNANDAVHHLVVAVFQTAAVTGVTTNYFQLLDGATAQCSIIFRQDGAILLTTGGTGGAVQATYAGAITGQGVWIALEIEVVIHNTAGSFTVRKNGNTSNDFTLGSLNTRGGTANNYANKLTLGCPSASFDMSFDDLLWRSDPTSVAWMGDVRSYVRMPASDASVQFSRVALPFSGNAKSSITSIPVGSAMFAAFTPSQDITASQIAISINIAYTGNLKCAVYNAVGNTPTTVLQAATAPISNPVVGLNNTFTFSPPLSLVKGVQYYIAAVSDTAVINGWDVSNAINGSGSATIPYASFPQANPAVIGGFGNVYRVTITAANYALVSEAQQDGTTTYVYDAAVGHGDLYNIAAASPTPTSVVAVTTRGFIEKSDAGARSGAVQLKSGVTTAQSASTVLTSSFSWLYRTDSTDPNTGSAWTPAAVDGLQIGPVVTA